MRHSLLVLLMALSVADGTINVTTGGIGTTFTVSGLSFQPKALIFFWSGRSSNGFSEEDSRFGVGYAVSTSSRRIYGGVSRHANASSSAFGMRRSDCCIATLSTGAVVNGRADLNAINADGFELIVDQAFAAALQVGWLALGGSDLTDAEIVDIQMPGASGDQDVSTSFALNTGEDDKALIFLGASANTANNPESSFRVSFGAAAGDTIVNALTSGMSRSGRPTMMTINYSRTGDCVAVANTGADDALAARAAVTDWLSTGFRLNWTITSAVTAHISALVLKGGRFSVGDALTSTGTSNQTESTAYQPKALLVGSHGKAASSAGTTQAGDERSIGVVTSSSSRRCASQHDRDGVADSDIAIGYHEDRIYNNIDTAAAAAIEGAMDLVSFDAAPSFTYVMDDADPVAAFFWYLLFADAPAGGGATNIDPGFIATTLQLFSPSLIEGAAIDAGFISNPATFHAPVLIAAAILSPGFVSNAPQVFDPSVESPVAILPGFIATTVQVFAPGVGQGIGTEFIASTAVVSDPTVIAALIILPATISPSSQVFEPSMGAGDFIDVGAFTATSQVFAPVFTIGETVTVTARIDLAATVPAPEYVRGVAIIPAFIASGYSVFDPQLVTPDDVFAFFFNDRSAPLHAFTDRSAPQFSFSSRSAPAHAFEDRSE